MTKTLAVDFDGVIHGYSKGWQDGVIYDDPKPGTKEAMTKLKEAGFELVIYSTRNYDRVIEGVFQPNHVKQVEEYLAKHEIPYDRIHTEPGKPFCKLFIDDNAIRFTDWDSALEQISALNL